VRPPRRRADATAGAACVVGGAVAIQSAAALAVGAFHAIGPAAASGFRVLPGAVVLAVVVRPRLRGRSPQWWAGVVVFGIAAAAMNLCFFQALSRLPLGTAVSIEFLGPFVLALAGGRGARHRALAVVGFAGVLLLARPGGGTTLVGVAFAVGAAIGWTAYTLASRRLGAVSEGFAGLAVSLWVASAVTSPFSLPALPSLTWPLAGRLVAMSVLSVVVGFGLELLALRRLRAAEVAVLFSLNPAIAFLLGWVVLGQHPALSALLGGLLVVAASLGVTNEARRALATLPPS
jgi:inner membrane transporter RhtA